MPRRHREEDEEDFTAAKKTKPNDVVLVDVKELSVSSTTSCFSSDDHDLTSCCSSNEEEDCIEVGTRTYNYETQRIQAEMSTDMNSKSEGKKKKEESGSLPAPTPMRVPQAELDAFFGPAEDKYLKEYKEKYNFDFVNDKPLEGKYEWVKMKP